MIIVENRQPRCTIVLGPAATWLERHAADELRSYLRSMTQAEVPVTSGGMPTGNFLAIGRADTNPVVAAAVKSGEVVLSEADPGLDGFVIKTVRLDGREGLVLGGSSDRGTLYAVYWLLEEILGVGFFRDGERVPESGTIDLPALAISERPYFADRHDGNGCIFTYSTSSWSFDEWKRELDWKAKRRVNSTWPFNLGGDILGRVMALWGVAPMPDAGGGEATVHEQAFNYARQLGIRVPCIIPNLNVSDALRARFPEVRALVLQYSELAPHTIVHPADPLYQRFVADWVRCYREVWGTDHVYIANFMSESKVLEGATNIHEARLDFVRAVSAGLLEADEQAEWAIETWSFDMDAEDVNHRWTPEQIREYLDAVTVPHRVWDLWSEERGKYLQTQNFFGHPWGFGVLHSFGANSYLHGDMQLLLERVRKVITAQDSWNCGLFIVQSEIIQFNSFYFEFCAELAWHPKAMSVGDFLVRYCRKRYGMEVGDALVPAWKMLVDTVYGAESGSVGTITDPLYWYRPDLYLLLGWTKPDEKTAALRARRAGIVPKLRDAIGVFLSREAALSESEMARRDFVDVLRQWVAERFNISLLSVRDAFLAGDRGTFEREAAACLALLGDQVRILASWPGYRLASKVEEHRWLYGEDAARWVKHTHVWVYSDPANRSAPLRDYYRMDLDGLVADYYAPRVEAYFGLLRAKMDAGETSVSDGEFDAAYAPIEEAFIAAPLSALPTNENPLEIAREILSRG